MHGGRISGGGRERGTRALALRAEGDRGGGADGWRGDGEETVFSLSLFPREKLKRGECSGGQ